MSKIDRIKQASKEARAGKTKPAKAPETAPEGDGKEEEKKND